MHCLVIRHMHGFAWVTAASPYRPWQPRTRVPGFIKLAHSALYWYSVNARLLQDWVRWFLLTMQLLSFLCAGEKVLADLVHRVLIRIHSFFAVQKNIWKPFHDNKRCVYKFNKIHTVKYTQWPIFTCKLSLLAHKPQRGRHLNYKYILKKTGFFSRTSNGFLWKGTFPVVPPLIVHKTLHLTSLICISVAWNIQRDVS